MIILGLIFLFFSCTGNVDYERSADSGSGLSDSGLGQTDTLPETADIEIMDQLEPFDQGLSDVKDSDGTEQSDVSEIDLLDEDATVPPPEADFSFVVIADSQFATESCTSGVSERLVLPRAIMEVNPTFILEAGDLMDHGYDDGAYAKFVSCFTEMLTYKAFFPTMGNHDAWRGAIYDYRTYLEKQLFETNPAVYGEAYSSDFAVLYQDDPTEYSESFSHPTHEDDVPSGVSYKTFYAFRFQNAYFISFEVGTRYWMNTPKSWLESHLTAARANPEIEFIFVFLHHPFYSTHMEESSTGECVKPVRDSYEPLLRQYDVTMAFSGHTHIYEHFYVPDNGADTRARPAPTVYANDRSAIHYVVNGGAGGPLPNNCNPMPSEKQQLSYQYSQARNCGYHFVQVTVAGKKIAVKVINVDGTLDSYITTIWDAFTIE